MSYPIRFKGHQADKQILGTEQDQMCGYHDRDEAGLLLEAAPEVSCTHSTSLDRKLIPSSQMLRYGCTRLEIGVQSVYEVSPALNSSPYPLRLMVQDVARDTNRGHTVRAVSESFHMSKDAGYKIVAHMMPDLPNCGTERDIWQFQVRNTPLLR